MKEEWNPIELNTLGLAMLIANWDSETYGVKSNCSVLKKKFGDKYRNYTIDTVRHARGKIFELADDKLKEEVKTILPKVDKMKLFVELRDMRKLNPNHRHKPKESTITMEQLESIEKILEECNYEL